MKISHIGGLIAAASQKATQPLKQVGAISVIERIVILFRQAGIFPIVVVTGTQEREVMYKLSAFGVIFLHNENNLEPELFESIKIGASYLQKMCDRVVFTPVNTPFFRVETLQTLIQTKGKIVCPSYHNQGGHPVVFSTKLIPSLLTYQGELGLKGFLATRKAERTYREVPDQEILQNLHERQIEYHYGATVHPVLELSLEKEIPFFNGRGKLLLLLVSNTNSVKSACDMMALSYAQAWKIINSLEKELGYAVVERQQGGYKGGNTGLTEKGKTFLLAYQRLEERVFGYTQKTFYELFPKP